MLKQVVHHVYDLKNQVLAHSLTTEELREILEPIKDRCEVVTLEVENYKEASW